MIHRTPWAVMNVWCRNWAKALVSLRQGSDAEDDQIMFRYGHANVLWPVQLVCDTARYASHGPCLPRVLETRIPCDHGMLRTLAVRSDGRRPFR